MSNFINIYRSKYDSKNLQQFLCNIYGLNKFTIKQICNSLGLNILTKESNLTDLQIKKIMFLIENKYITDIVLKHRIITNIKHLMDIHCLKGIKHRLRLPVRGQNTHNNAKTIKKLNIFPKT